MTVISSTFMVKLFSSVIAMLRVAMLCPAPVTEGAAVENLPYTTPPPPPRRGGYNYPSYARYKRLTTHWLFCF